MHPSKMRPKASHGSQTSKADRGTRIKESFGADSSDVTSKNQRGGDCGGGPTNLSHSLSGTKAKQK